GARRDLDPLVEAALELALVESREQAHSLSQRTRKIELAVHRALGDARDLLLETRVVRELVDAFLANDRRIHVGDEEALPARFVLLNDNIDIFQRREGPTGTFEIARKSKVRSITLVDPAKKARLRVDFAKQAERLVDQPVIEPPRCYQR